MSNAVNPEPIAQLQRQLDEFRSTQPRGGGGCRSRCGKPRSNWPGNTGCIPSRTRYGWTIYMGLKKRLGGVSHSRRKARRPAFVELIAPHAALRECLIEFESQLSTECAPCLHRPLRSTIGAV
jgi:hypothetical protein